jgi:NCS1 family nucleobase:cation symporter-1
VHLALEAHRATGGYIFTWLIGYSALLGPIGGILIADYFIVRRLCSTSRASTATRAPTATAAASTPSPSSPSSLAVCPISPASCTQAGAFGPWRRWVWDTIYTYAWFVGFALAAGSTSLS